MSNNTDASGVIAGFVYQIFYFLYRLLKIQDGETVSLESEGEFIALTVEENFVPEQQTPAGWQVERLILKSPTGDEMEIKCTNLFAVAELLRKMS